MLILVHAHTDTIPRHAYSLEEAARSISLSRRALYNLIEAGALRTVKLGRRRIVPRDELERLCAVEQALR
jgi:excisionase family DNA binding protein